MNDAILFLRAMNFTMFFAMKDAILIQVFIAKNLSSC
jgi:hypothetical protein